MSHTFRFMGGRIAANLWQLSPEDSQHAAKVLRLRAGNACEVTDGKGNWASGTLGTSTDINGLVVHATAEHVAALPSLPLCLVVGALKFRSFDDVLPALVELGIDQLHIFLQAGNEAERIGEKAQGRWQRILVEAIKQSKQAHLPEIYCHRSLELCLDSLPKEGSLWFADPDAAESAAVAAIKDRLSWVIGGEMALSEAELKILQSRGFIGVRLAAPILRATTAMIAATAVLAARRL